MARVSGTGGDVYVASQLVSDAETQWTTAGAGRVCSVDNADKKVGSGSAKLVTTSIGATTLLETIAVGPLDLTGAKEVLLWIKSSINQNSGDCQLLLDEHSGCVSPLESIDIPALTAGVWKLCKLALANPASDGAIISVGIKQIVDLADMSFWVDEIRAAKATAGVKLWTLDTTIKVLDSSAFDTVGVDAFLAANSGWKGTFEGYKDGGPLPIGTVTHLELRESATSTQQWRGSAVIMAVRPKTAHEVLVGYIYDFQGIHKLEEPTA